MPPPADIPSVLNVEPRPCDRIVLKELVGAFDLVIKIQKTITSRGWSNRCQRWSWFCIHGVFSLASVPALFAFDKEAKTI
ncbi:MAG: hypothetical protein ACK5VX_12300 [Akkermansiaceae bacterium]